MFRNCFLSEVRNILICVPSKRNTRPLSETHPELAKEAEGWDPSLVTAGSSSKSLSWKCAKGHIWNANIPRRAGKQSSGCPYCSNFKALSGFNDIATTNPEIAREADGWDPTEFVAGSNKKQKWKCSLGHNWNARPADRIGKNSKCPYCSNSKLLTGFNDLASEFPEIAKEADGWDPTQVISRTGKVFNWRCNEGHTWSNSPNARIRKESVSKCPYCSNHFAWAGFNDLATTHPEIAKEAYGWDPTKFIAGSAKKLEWKCTKGHIFVMSLNNKLSHDCSVCANRQINLGVNDLASQYPEIAKEAYEWDPRLVTFSNGTKKSWICSRNHIYKSSPKSRTGKYKTGCPYCSNNLVLPGFNDLKTRFPEIAEEANGWEPSQYIPGSHVKKSWKCKLGHTWLASLGSRTERRSGCPTCANKVILSGFNDLNSLHPSIASQADGWDPKIISAGSHKKLNWICEFGHKWTAVVVVRTQSNSGCPSCFGTGYDSNLNGWFYLIEQKELGFQQIGISNYPEKRLKTHGKRGWQLIELRGPMDGVLAREIETSVLRMLRKNGAQMIKGSDHQQFDGYSESWMKNSFDAISISSLIQLANEQADR